MKIYLADTIQRDDFGYNTKFGVRNHLESYAALLLKKKDLRALSIFKPKSKKKIGGRK